MVTPGLAAFKEASTFPLMSPAKCPWSCTETASNLNTSHLKTVQFSKWNNSHLHLLKLRICAAFGLEIMFGIWIPSNLFWTPWATDQWSSLFLEMELRFWWFWKIKCMRKGSTCIVLEKFKPTFKHIGVLKTKLAYLKVWFFSPSKLFDLIGYYISLQMLPNFWYFSFQSPLLLTCH